MPYPETAWSYPTRGCNSEGECHIRIVKAVGSTPISSTIILGQKRCHAVKTAWHKAFLGVIPPIFYTSKSGMKLAFSDIPEIFEPS